MKIEGSIITSLHMQQCILWDCIRPLAPSKAVFDFQSNQRSLNDLIRNKNTVELQWLEHRWLGYHGLFELIFESLRILSDS